MAAGSDAVHANHIVEHVIARDLLAAVLGEHRGLARAHPYRIERRLRLHLAQLDHLPIATISAPIVAPILTKLESDLPDMAAKVRQRLRQFLIAALNRD